MKPVQQKYVENLMIDLVGQLNSKITSNFLLLTEARSFNVLMSHLETFINDLSEDEEVKTIIDQYRMVIEKSTYEHKRNRRKTIQWIRKHLSTIRSNNALFERDLRLKIEDTYRFLSRTKKRVRVNMNPSKYVLAPITEYWTGGFVLACWWKFREICSEVAKTGHFHLLSGIADCEMMNDSPIYHRTVKKTKKKVLYPGMRGVKERLKNESQSFIKLFDMPTKHFDENYDPVPYKKIIIRRGRIRESKIPHFLEALIPKNNEVTRDLLQTSPAACLMTLEGLLNGKDRQELNENSVDKADLEDIEERSHLVWHHIVKARGGFLSGADFAAFREEVIDKAKTLIYYLVGEKSKVQKLRGNLRTQYFKEKVRGVIYLHLKEYMERLPKKSWLQVRYRDAIDSAKLKIATKCLSNELTKAFSDNLWSEEVKRVAQELGWRPKGGRPFNSSS